MLNQLDTLLAGNELGEAGVANLRQVFSGVEAAGLPADRMKLDVSIARGLDYYTGVIFETFLGQLPNIGSVCSGGRYDDLAGVYTKQKLPGIGASLGLDRLLAAMEELKLIEQVSTPAQVLITYFDKDQLNVYLRLAAQLARRAYWSNSTPSQNDLVSSSSTQTGAVFHWPSSRAKMRFRKGFAKSKTCSRVRA